MDSTVQNKNAVAIKVTDEQTSTLIFKSKSKSSKFLGLLYQQMQKVDEKYKVSVGESLFDAEGINSAEVKRIAKQAREKIKDIIAVIGKI